jgi:predicted TPR repeat methyltransferase
MPAGLSGWRADLAAISPVLAGLPVSEASAIALAAHGRLAAAEAAYRELLAREPHHLSALRALAIACKHQGLHDEAESLEARALLSEAHWLGVPAAQQQTAADYFRAARGACATPAAAPAALIGAQFDRYAATYDQHLASLAFRVPEVLAQALTPWLVERRRSDVCDLGCGTGLLGARLRAHAGRLTGVDLSAGMIDAARAKNVYDELAVDEAVGWLDGRDRVFDLVVASDVLPYIGDLSGLFAAVSAALRPGGRFACTGEAGSGETYELRTSRRFAHGREYLRSCAERAGLSVVMLAETCGRLEAGEPVPMHLLVAQSAAS